MSAVNVYHVVQCTMSSWKRANKPREGGFINVYLIRIVLWWWKYPDMIEDGTLSEQKNKLFHETVKRNISTNAEER